MIVKIALLFWIVAFFLSLIGKGKERSWMARLFVAGFCLLLLGIFLKLIGRMM
jgi:hypothetical protein